VAVILFSAQSLVLAVEALETLVLLRRWLAVAVEVAEIDIVVN